MKLGGAAAPPSRKLPVLNIKTKYLQINSNYGLQAIYLMFLPIAKYLTIARLSVPFHIPGKYEGLQAIVA